MSQEGPSWKFGAGDPGPSANSLLALDDGNIFNSSTDISLLSTPSGAADAHITAGIFDGELQFDQSMADGSLQFATIPLADGTHGLTQRSKKKGKFGSHGIFV